MFDVHILGNIYTRAKVKAKATSLPMCCIVFNPCVSATATAAATKIKEKIAFAFALVQMQLRLTLSLCDSEAPLLSECLHTSV